MKTTKILITMCLAVLLAGTNLNAQVTIGSQNDPHPAAVLDLQSTTKGFKLPNVALNLSDLTQFILDGEAQKVEATGMLVYNTSNKSIYIWDGARWNPVLGGGGQLSANCPGTFFTVNVADAPAMACGGSMLSTTIKITATGGTGIIIYGGDFNADGTLKSGITMPTSDGKVLHALITDGTGCYVDYYFSIPLQTTGCGPIGDAIAVGPGVFVPDPTNKQYYTASDLTSSMSATQVQSKFTNVPGKTLYMATSDESSTMNWSKAQSTCAGKGSGWRLPNIAELSYLQGISGSPTTNYYWSNTEYNPDYSWTWYFLYGKVQILLKSDVSIHTRCVWSN